MSRKGNKLLTIPNQVTLSLSNNVATIKGPLGTLTVNYPSTIEVNVDGSTAKVSRTSEDRQTRKMHGTVNSNISNALVGVSAGYTKILNIVGVGYKANVAGNKLTLDIGFSHQVVFNIPTELKVTCPSQTQIVISGYDKILVGEFTAKVRATRKPEPYNGKGIMYSDEIIVRKVGKTAEGAKK
jgi:large subunit ribosomal protein L6